MRNINYFSGLRGVQFEFECERSLVYTISMKFLIIFASLMALSSVSAVTTKFWGSLSKYNAQSIRSDSTLPLKFSQLYPLNPSTKR